MSVLEERLFADAADGRLDEFTPLGAALVAGGVLDDAELRHYERKAAALVDELRGGAKGTVPFSLTRKLGQSPTRKLGQSPTRKLGQSPTRKLGQSPTRKLGQSPREQAEAIFRFLHERVFRGGYDLGATDLRQTLDEGRFNCVSAAVLFNYLGGQCGLECRGLEMPSHAMTRVIFPDGAIDIELTCPQWFDIVAGTCGVPSPSPVREVTPIQMLAMIYYNRGVDDLSSKRFAEAAAANAKALRLDPENTTARGNLLATINNWSIELGNRRHYAEALDLLRQGMAIDANFSAFSRNYAHLSRQWAEHLRQEDNQTARPATSGPFLVPTRFGN